MDQQPVTPSQPTTNNFSSQPELPNIPQTWPGKFGLYKYSKKAVMLNIGTLLLLIILSLAINIPSSFIPKGSAKNIADIVTYIVSFFVSVALLRTYIASIRGQKMAFGKALAGSSALLVLKYFVVSLLVGIICVVSFLLLIVPFFFVFPRLLLAEYYLVDKNMGPIEAIKSSWYATKGWTGLLWGIIVANLLMGLLMLTIIGIPFALYFLLMYSAAYALAYEFISKRHQTESAPAVSELQQPV